MSNKLNNLIAHAKCACKSAQKCLQGHENRKITQCVCHIFNSFDGNAHVEPLREIKASNCCKHKCFYSVS